jgi:uncharacterized membrane protein YphA (DoxX/SURF4 family)
MKILIIIVRVLLGLAFVVFGLNGFLHFIKQPPPNPGLAADFAKALFESHYFYVVSALQVAGGALLLLGSRFVPLGLMLLGPVVVNILLFHIFLEPKGLGMALLFSALSLFLLWAYRHAFAGIINPPAPDPKPAAQNPPPATHP